MTIQLPTTRLGFHYFPDFVHYRQADLHAWLPELQRLKVGWLTLLASTGRAIPEFFLRGLLDAGIQPVLHFQLSLHEPVDAQELGLLFNSYARWGVRFVALFDRPNTRQAWPASAWPRANLVERFLDIYLPLAELALKSGLYPVFPPLEPGGDYWDTAFLQAALHAIQRRGHQALLDRLVLGAYAWSGNLPLNWGAGGPERWPEARPYQPHQQTQDQRGFRIYDWYQAAAQAVLGKPAPVILLRAGSRPGDQTLPDLPPVDADLHTRTNLALAQLAASPAAVEGSAIEPLPAQVLACCFWLMAASPLSVYKADAWFQADGSRMPVVEALARWQEQGQSDLPASESKMFSPDPLNAKINQGAGGFAFDHYLLLPSYEWGLSDWHMEAIRPFVKKYRPTIGFSVKDASKARKVTMVGEFGMFPENAVDELVSSGCIVVEIRGTGTELASKLASL